ncbi:MAG: GreA/GreB family elongation factor [Firmicutes bacterium]|nr:GreA/GreB family elongation factor [Bacillota bacterium]
MEKTLLDANGFKQYETAVVELKQKIRDTQLEKNEAAGIAYDWHDNAGFEHAQGQEMRLHQQLRRLQEQGSTFELVERGNDRTVVDIGDTVTVDVEYAPDDIEVSTYHLTGNFKNMSDDEVSINSPIGESMYGKEAGSEFSFPAGHGVAKGVIVSFEATKKLSKLAGKEQVLGQEQDAE